MSKNEDPRNPLARLSKPKPDAETPEPDEGKEPSTPMEKLFHHDTDTHITALFGLTEKRNAARMRTGHSRIPPRLAEKMTVQIEAKAQLVADILQAIERAEAAGIHVNVTRFAIRSVLKSDELQRDEDPL